MWLSVILLEFIFVLLVLLTIFHYLSRGRKYWMRRNVAYREPCPIFGNFGAALTMRRSYSHTLQYYYNSFLDEKVVGIFQARRPTLMVMDLDIVKHVFSTDFSHFSDRISVFTDTKREPMLRNLANMSGAEWKAMRQIVTPSFSSAKMKAMFPLVANCAKFVTSTLLKEAKDNVDVPNLVSRYTTDVIGNCAFGVNPRSLENPDSPFLKMSQKMFRVSRSTILKRYLRTFFPSLFKLLNLKSYPTDVEAFFTNIIRQVLTERRKTGSQRPDFLQLMLNVQKNASGFDMTDELITSNSFIFMLAGLETSSTTLSFCLYELAKHTELQEELRKEILYCLDQHGGLNYDAVTAMPKTAQAIMETLRLHPPTPFTTRVCTSPCTLPETEFIINKKDAILIPIHSIQKDPKHFADPEKFKPERFKDDAKSSAFLAFGDGPRSCPGDRFAHLMIAACLSEILSNFSVEPCEKTTSKIEYDARSVMLKNKGGIWLKFKPL